ncbi:MAG: hypothetical protein AAFY76_19290 [Cyanobacteria bacterium J06649_11]
MALGFLPIAVVRMNFVRLRNSQLTRLLIGRFPALGDFFNYFSNNYLTGNLPPQIWNVFARTIEELAYVILPSGPLFEFSKTRKI